MMEYISVGYPIGQLDNEERKYFFVGGQMLALNTFAYKIWLCFFGGNRIENVVRNPELLQEMGSEQLQTIIEEMIRTGLMISIDEAENYIPLRQGIGVGYKNGGYIVYTDKMHKLDYTSYLVWSYCDGRRKFSDIFAKLRSLDVPIAGEEEKRIVYALFHELVLFLSLED